MNHPDLPTLLDAGLGDSAEGTSVRAHLRDCPGCRSEVERTRERRDDLRRHYAALELPPSEAVEERVRRILRASPAATAPRPVSARLFALAAASLVIAAAMWWSIPSREPRQDRTGAPEPPVRQEPAPEEIAARINGQVLTWKEVEESLMGIKPKDITEALRDSKRRMMAEEMLYRQYIERKKITVTEKEVDELIERDVRSYGGREEYERMVRLRYGTSAKAREDRRWGLLTWRAWDYVCRNAATDPELQGAGWVSEQIPESDLRAYYESHRSAFEAFERISFMRIGVMFSDPSQEERARALLESLERKLEKGAEFVMLAFNYSDVRRAKNFRDLNVTRKDLEGVYSSETIRYLFETLKENEVSPILRDGTTLNLFRMEQKVLQKAETFEEARAKIRAKLENDAREKNRAKFRDLLRRQARIEPADLFGEK
jgi:hypothetical protein